ncbi:MAG: GNAT family N-acetyltransferase [Roseivirga sp.]|nr:GNAT family N-acetyltransferase [Roseivirga sp.]
MSEIRRDIFLEGTSVYLRALEEKDVSGNYSFWLNDPEIVQFNSHGRFPMTVPMLKAFAESSQRSTNALILAIVDKQSDIHIGNISLQGINWVDRNAEIAFLLGERAFWGKGIMFEAGSLLIKHGFEALNLHRVHCGTSSANVGMQKLAVKLGMKQEGVRKEALFNHGEYHDIIEYGILNKA